MIYLAVTRAGVKKALDVAAATGASVWCGADAMTEQEFDTYASSSATRFAYPLMSVSEEVFAGAIETIREHHPAATIWVESKT